MTDQLDVLRASVTRLRAIVEGFDADQIRARAYPAAWTVADVLSHLASAAIILQTSLDAGLAGEQVADDLAQSTWDEWNAKAPDAKAADGLNADRVFFERLESLDESERARASVRLGPLTLDFAALVGTRIGEHALHTWDIEVVLDPNATVPADAAAVVVDRLGLIVQYVGKPTGIEHDVRIHTVDPIRDFVLTLGADALVLAPAGDDIPNRPLPDLELPAEAFVRLVYGRLDPAHTPTGRGDALIEELRRAFPGV